MSQLVASTKDAAGAYNLIGQVIVTDGNAELGWPELRTDGSIRVVVTGPLEPAGAATSQWQSFRWGASGFEQVGAPVNIPAIASTQLALTATPQAIAGNRTTLAVTVHNGGPASSDYLLVSFRSTVPMTVKPEGLGANLRPVGCQTAVGCLWGVRVEPVASGTSAAWQFTVELTGSGPSGSWLSVNVGGWIRGPGAQPNAGDANMVTVPVTVS